MSNNNPLVPDENGMVTITCAGCKKPFRRKLSRIQNKTERGQTEFFCKPRCYTLTTRARRHSRPMVQTIGRGF